MNRRLLLLLAIVLVAVMLGAVREFLFINLNYQIDHLANRRPVSYAHSMFQRWVAGADLSELIWLKWLLSLLFMAIMLGLGILLSRSLFGDHRYAGALAIAYALLGLLALLFHWISGGTGPWYNISIKLLHALQYPVLLVFIWGGAQLARHRR